MKIDLSGKTAVVTGSSAGIGFAIAKGLAHAGARVIVNSRHREGIDSAIAKIKDAVPGAKLEGVAADVSNAAGCATLAKAFPEADILVNNAGGATFQDFFQTPDAEWIRMFEWNLMSGVRMARALMPGMLKRDWGRIVFISSESALHIPKEMIHYGMVKASQLAVSRGLAELTAGTGVTVNSVLPGPTKTERMEGFMKATAEREGTSFEEASSRFVKNFRSTSLIQRMATTEEVANMVVYVCSPQASATNGAALRVEGGIVRTIA